MGFGRISALGRRIIQKEEGVSEDHKTFDSIPSHSLLPPCGHFIGTRPMAAARRILRLSTASAQEIHAEIHLVHKRYCVVHRLFYCVAE